VLELNLCRGRVYVQEISLCGSFIALRFYGKGKTRMGYFLDNYDYVSFKGL